MVSPVPDGFGTLTPHITVSPAAEAIEFYKKAFGAEEVCRMGSPMGEQVMHCELKIGSSMLMLNDEFPGDGPKSPKSLHCTPATMHLYVDDVDAAFQRAVDAGAEVTMPVADMFWGDRYGRIKDPFGHHWAIATHKEDLTDEEMGKRAAQAFGGEGPCPE